MLNRRTFQLVLPVALLSVVLGISAVLKKNLSMRKRRQLNPVKIFWIKFVPKEKL